MKISSPKCYLVLSKFWIFDIKNKENLIYKKPSQTQNFQKFQKQPYNMLET